MRVFAVVVVVILVAVAAPAQAPLIGEEIPLLLEMGVPPGTVLDALHRRGGPESVDARDLERARDLGVSPALEAWMATRLSARRRLEQLAELYAIHVHEESGLTALYPRSWQVVPRAVEQGSFVTFTPEAGNPGNWFSVPRVFVLVQNRTAFPEEAGEALARRLGSVLARRLVGHGLAVAEIQEGRGRVGDREVFEMSVAGEEARRGFRGRMVLRTRVLPRGSVISVGYACALADLDRIQVLFDEIAGSCDVTEAR